MKKIILLNIYLLLFWILSMALASLQYPFFSYLKSFSSLLILFPLLGINLTAILQLYYQDKLSRIEILSISSILSLIIAPLLLSLEYELSVPLQPALPFLNSIVSLLVLLLLYQKKKYVDFSNFDFLNYSKLKIIGISSFLKSTFIWGYLVNLFVIILIFLAFEALPELDPYYWYAIFLDQFSQNTLTSLSGYRPLFISLIYIFNQSASVDLFAFFKYVLPFFSLLILIPAYLTIYNEENKLKQLSILLTPFITVSTFLYLQIPIPQAIFNIILFYFSFFLIYSLQSQKSLFYFLGGFVAFFSYFYHESAIMIFAVWASVTIFIYYKKIFLIARNNRFSTVLIILIILLNFSEITHNQSGFLLRYIAHLSSFGNFNFLFPSQYVNIDGNAMGWSGFAGVAKYYAYYVGPVILFLILSLSFFYFKSLEFRKFFTREIKKKESVVLLILFVLFFFIAEILPRFFNLALLPERAWMFCGIFSLIFIFYIFKFNNGKVFQFFLILAFLINIGGALYINNLKKYVITENQIVSTKWIQQELPVNRIIFSSNNGNLIKFYSKSKYVGVLENFYFNEDVYREAISEFKDRKIDTLPEEYKKLSKSIKKLTSKIDDFDPISQQDQIVSLMQKNIQSSEELLNLITPNRNKITNDDSSLYIFYAKPNEKNPYINRPYNKSFGETSNFIFDKYPDEFKRVYAGHGNDVIIWEIL